MSANMLGAIVVLIVYFLCVAPKQLARHDLAGAKKKFEECRSIRNRSDLCSLPPHLSSDRCGGLQFCCITSVACYNDLYEKFV